VCTVNSHWGIVIPLEMSGTNCIAEIRVIAPVIVTAAQRALTALILTDKFAARVPCERIILLLELLEI